MSINYSQGIVQISDNNMDITHAAQMSPKYEEEMMKRSEYLKYLYESYRREKLRTAKHVAKLRSATFDSEKIESISDEQLESDPTKNKTASKSNNKLGVKMINRYLLTKPTASTTLSPKCIEQITAQKHRRPETVGDVLAQNKLFFHYLRKGKELELAKSTQQLMKGKYEEGKKRTYYNIPTTAPSKNSLLLKQLYNIRSLKSVLDVHPLLQQQQQLKQKQKSSRDVPKKAAQTSQAIKRSNNTYF